MSGARRVSWMSSRTRLLDAGAVAAAIRPDTMRSCRASLRPDGRYGAIPPSPEQHGLPIVEDAAQAHGATYRRATVGSLGRIGGFSFYPGKNLGAYGDGGAVTTDDADLAQVMRELRHGGQRDRYHHVRLGFCNRLDEIQAAVLRVKLRYLQAWNAARAARAAHYTRLLAAAGNPVQPLAVRPYGDPVYHLYVVRAPGRRDALMAALERAGIASLYPLPGAGPLASRL